MPPASRISQLPEDIRQWLEYALEASGFHYYREITEELNRRLREAGFDGNLSAETVRRHGAKAAAKIDLRDNLIEHIRQELDPGRNIPPADWNRAVVSAIGFFNYRTLTDLQCQETVSVKEHSAFVRSLIQTHHYEQMLGVQPLKPEELPAAGPRAANMSFRPEPEGRSGGISCQPGGETPPLRAAPSGRGDTGETGKEAPAPLAVPPENTEKHRTIPGPDNAMDWEGVPRHLRRQIVRIVSELRARPQDGDLRRKLDTLLAEAERYRREEGGEKRAA